MATYDYEVTITDQTSGTVTLTSSPFTIRNWAPEAEEFDNPTVKNELDVRVNDGSVAANLDEIRTLQKLLRQSREAQINRTIDRVYLTWKENASANLYRSEIVAAKANFDETALHYGYWTGDTQFPLIELTRKNYWEGPEAQVPLTNPNGTADTSGLTVYNCNDGDSGTRYNYIDIAGTSVAGDLPGATRLELTNTFATGQLGSLWIGHNYTNTSFDHWLEAEEASHSGSVSAGTYSGGTSVYFGSIPVDVETDLLTWTLDSTYMSNAGGAYYRVIIVGRNELLSYIRHRLKLKYGTTVVWQSDLITPQGNNSLYINDLITIQLPPWLAGLSNLAQLSLVLSAYETDVSPTAAQGYDAIQITPVDGFRFLQFLYGAAQNSRVVDDGINNHVYIDDGSGSSKVGVYGDFGSPIMLKPATNQRLYFLMHANSGAHYVSRTASVKLYYRPRRLSL